MRVEVRPIYVKGRASSTKARASQAPVVGRLIVQENRLNSAGRNVTFARVRANINGVETDMLPELADARVLWMFDRSVRITGVEKIDDVLYAQTWDIEVISC